MHKLSVVIGFLQRDQKPRVISDPVQYSSANLLDPLSTSDSRSLLNINQTGGLASVAFAPCNIRNT